MKKYILGIICVALSAAVLIFTYRSLSGPAQDAETISRPPPAKDDWGPITFTDSLTGKKTTEYAGATTTLDGPQGITATVRIRCLDNSLDAFVLFNRFFSSKKYLFWQMTQNQLPVPVGFISGKGTDGGRAVFLSDETEVQALLELLKDDSKDLRLRIYGAEGPQITVKLGLKGAPSAVENVRRECSRWR